jgi:hypothetical protein
VLAQQSFSPQLVLASDAVKPLLVMYLLEICLLTVITYSGHYGDLAEQMCCLIPPRKQMLLFEPRLQYSKKDP